MTTQDDGTREIEAWLALRGEPRAEEGEPIGVVFLDEDTYLETVWGLDPK